VSQAGIRESAPGRLELSGVLDYSSGPQLRVAGQSLIRASSQPELVLDCSAVDKSSSVGLSLLLCYLRDAAAADKRLSISGLPEDMREIAEVCGLDELLPLQAV
jgi:phospholipid transport system transporter-binding protein